MTLLDWIDGTAIPTLATATPATVATESTSKPRSVAEVATVAVAQTQNRETGGGLVRPLRRKRYNGPFRKDRQPRPVERIDIDDPLGLDVDDITVKPKAKEQLKPKAKEQLKPKVSQ